MKFESKKFKSWLKTKEPQLPGLTTLLTTSKADILMIGAAVFELYELQGWLPVFKRKTGDIDLSVGLIKDDVDYQSAKKILVDHKYRLDDVHPYRYHSPKIIVGGYTYIDLLAHPANGKVSDEQATATMGVGPGFTFKGFSFAQLASYSLTDNVIFPNPFGLMALKRESYLNEPTKRVRDFADIVELINGLVEKGTHFEMENLWLKVSKEQDAKDIRAMVSSTSSVDTAGAWDIDNVRKELNYRNFDDKFIDETLMQRLKDFHDILE